MDDLRPETAGKKASFPPLHAKAALAELDLRTCSAFNPSKKPAWKSSALCSTCRQQKLMTADHPASTSLRAERYSEWLQIGLRDLRRP